MKRLTINRKITVLGAIPILAFVIFASIFVWSKWQDVQLTRSMQTNAELLKSASNLIIQVQRERGTQTDRL
jgi:hypothetical protein